MCGTADFYNPHDRCPKEEEHYESILRAMAERLRHRDPDDAGRWLWERDGLSHARLSIIDLAGDHQPMVKSSSGQTFAIIYNGELYSTDKLRQESMAAGCSFQASSNTEVILAGYVEYDPDFVKRLDSIFAFATMNTAHNRLCLFRDRIGVKPLFYTTRDEELIFSSKLKGILACLDIETRSDCRGLNEVFSVGPAKTYGYDILKDMKELFPGRYLIYGPNEVRQQGYWELVSRPREGSYERTIEKISFLVRDSVHRQTVSDVSICTFLSGGVDSSLVSTICTKELKKQGKRLTTFSFDFVGNDKLSRVNPFQPSRYCPYVDQMVRFLDSDHHCLECGNLIQADRLFDSVLTHDLPAIGDIDSSMLRLCPTIREYNKVVLIGECTDEIFGDYPWFRKKECFEAHTFPWTMDLSPGKSLLDDSFLEHLGMNRYVMGTYGRSVAETPVLAEDSPGEAGRREVAWLNLRWFMQILFNRIDRTDMYSGLEVRVPFADHWIIEYVWNVPRSMKTRDGLVKNLLRQSGKGLLPGEILFRKKPPYPKTYDTAYEELPVDRVREMVGDSHSPVVDLLDQKKLIRFLTNSSDYGKPWCGQLVTGLQVLAYILQVNF